MLPFTHDFIFGMVMRDPEVCREFLRTVLPKENFREVKMRMPENPLLSEEWAEEAVPEQHGPGPAGGRR